MWRVHRPHLVHFFSDEVVVSEGFKERERLVGGIGDVHLCLNEVLEKNLLNSLCIVNNILGKEAG